MLASAPTPPIPLGVHQLHVQHLLDEHAPSVELPPTFWAVEPHANAHASAISACADVGEWRGACALLQQMSELQLNISGPPLTAALRACAESHQWEQAASLLRMAWAEGAACSCAAYTHVISAAEKNGHSAEAMQIYAMAVREGAFVHWRDTDPFTIDVHSFNIEVAVCAVRYALQHEIGNYIQDDLKIIASHRASIAEAASKPALLERIEMLLSSELDPPLAFDHECQTRCDQDGCEQSCDQGCLVIQLQELFRWLTCTKPFEAYVVAIPSPE